MLKVFRDNLRYLSWVLWLVILVFVLFVFVDFGATVPGGSVPTDAAATVGGHKVTYADYERAYRQAESFYQNIYGEQFNREMARQMGLPQQVLEGLVADRILMAEAERMGLMVTDSEVQSAILELPVFQDESGNFVGEEQYRQILRANGLTTDGFERGFRSDLSVQKVRDALGRNLFVSDEETERAYRERVETASIRFIELPSAELGDVVEISDEELRAAFDAEPEAHRIPEQRVVDYVLVEPAAVRATLQIEDAELRDYYDRNTDQYSQEEQVRARHILLRTDAERTPEMAAEEIGRIRARIEAGEDFATLAGELSDDPGSKARGGDLGFFGRGQMVGEFEQAAFGAAPGELVGPVSTTFGAHLILVEERRDAGVRPFEDVREQIRNQILLDRSATLAESKANELADRIGREGLTEPEALRALVTEELAATLETTAPFGRDDDVIGIGSSAIFSQAVFELAEGGVSGAVRVPRGWVVAVLREIREPRIPEFEEVREDVEQALRVERQRDLAFERLTRAREELAGGKTLDEVAEELSLQVRESGAFNENGTIAGLGRSAEVVAAAFALDAGDVGGPVAHGENAVLFEVTERVRFDPVQFAAARDDTRESVRSERLNQMLGSLIEQRREELTVSYDDNLLQNLGITGADGTG